MFLRIIKETFLKKIVNKRLSTYTLKENDQKIKTIGVLIDVSNFNKEELLLGEIKKHNQESVSVEVLRFKEKVSKKELLEEPYFTAKDVSIKGQLKKECVKEFLDKPFDMLINYYDEPKASLNLAAKKSKATFKVGFDAVDKRINHFMISTKPNEYKVFVSELFKYLHILNKI